MQRFDILCGFLGYTTIKRTSEPLQQLGLPLRNLIGVQFKPLSELCRCLFPLL